jgi:diguanylate cyclase (GGDEF)-like protein
MKKTNTLQIRLLCIIVTALLLASLLVGGISIYEFDQYVQSANREILDALCDKEAERIDSMFYGMESSVHVMANYILSFYKSESDILDEAKKAEVETAAKPMFYDVARYTEGTIAYHLRFNPDLFGGSAGFYYTKRADNGDFTPHVTTNLTEYDESNTDAVGWFWKPYRAGKAVWIMPYNYKGTGTRMISYSQPLFLNGKFIGVVGMDFDYKVITDIVDEIKVHDNGFAFLAHHNHIAYHKDMELKDTTPDFSSDYEQESNDLRNGMTLVLLANKSDLRSIRLEAELRVAIVILVLLGLAVAITVYAVKRFTSPLRKLAESAAKLAEGNYNVETVKSGVMEIEMLNSAFEKMAKQLSLHNEQQHRLAYRDSMTGLRNSTSYKAWTDEFDTKIGDTIKEFGIAVLDINYLKITNDKYGHDVGNQLIVAAARMISYVFKRSPVFRVGGDEFVVILQDHDLKDYNELLKVLVSRTKEEFITFGDVKIPISIACGVAFFDEANDKGCADVFRRADTNMYDNKKDIKIRDNAQDI